MQIYLINMDVILTLSIKFRLSWDSNTVDCRQVAEEEQVAPLVHIYHLLALIHLFLPMVHLKLIS